MVILQLWFTGYSKASLCHAPQDFSLYTSDTGTNKPLFRK